MKPTFSIRRGAGPLFLAVLCIASLALFCPLPAARGGDFVSAPAPAGEMRDLLRLYNYLDLAECLREFRDREYFEFMYRQAHVDKTAENTFIVGLMYHHGLGVERDPAEAARWYGRASELGYDFKPFLGNEAAKGLKEIGPVEEPKRPSLDDEPLEWEREILEAGGAKAMLGLALRYQYGLCAPMDYEAAMRWEIRAARTGDKEACVIVADSYLFGYNAYPVDKAEAAKWRARADAAPPALKLPHTAEDVAALLRSPDSRPRALPDIARDIYREGRRHYDGGDYFQAGLRFAEAAAFSVDVADNYFLLGHIQENGLCGLANPYGAGKHYRIAAEMDHGEARLRLARLHEEGVGVRRSLFQAERLYAGAGDTPGAADRLRALRAEKTPGYEEEWERSPEFQQMLREAWFRAAFNYSPFRLPDEMRRARRWLLLSAGDGFAPAQYELGLLFLKGEPESGIPQSTVEARLWLEKALEGGVAEAAELLRNMR